MGQTVTVVGCNPNTKKQELKKHAATIHCSNTLSLLQRKITNALLYHAYNELMQKEEHEITVKQLCRLIGYQGNNHAAIKEALKGLLSTIIEWNLINDETGSENWTASSIIASVSLEGPLCYYAYSPRMKQLLHTPSMFGKIDLVIQSKFRSSYGLALYENCIRYRGLPKTKWFDIELFKKLMGVPVGSKYDIFRDFKRRVLDKAVDEVNTYSNLIIAPELSRERRKVTKIRFGLKERAKKTRLGKKERRAISATHLNAKLIDFGFSIYQVEQLLTDYEPNFIEEKIKLIEGSKAYKEGRIENLTAYFLSALKNNYQAPRLQVVEKPNSKADDIELSAIKRQAEELWLAYHFYREQVIQESIQALEAPEKQKFMQEFFIYAEQTINTILQLQRSKYSKATILESPHIKAQLRQFALRELDLMPICSIEEFVAMQDESKREAWQKLKSYDPDHPWLRVQEVGMPELG